MSIEAWKLKEQENKKKKLSEKEVTENSKKIIEHQKVKEHISVEIEAEENLTNLKDLVEKWIITKEVAEKVINKEGISEDIIKEIFEKIDQIDEIKNIDQYIPAELRITKEDYSKALNNDIFRVQIITKLDSALALLSNKINPDSAMGLNLFSGFLTVLDKNLILVQENTIDVKESLKEIDEKKFWKKNDNRNLWQKIKDFLKEVFSK